MAKLKYKEGEEWKQIAPSYKEFTALKEDYVQQRHQDQLKVAKVEKGLNDYQSTIANVNVNQEVKQSVSGYGVVSLPKNTANGQVSSIGIKGRTLKNELNYNRDTWEEWGKLAGLVVDAYGLEFTFSDTEYVQARIPTVMKPSTKYGVLTYVSLNTLLTQSLQIDSQLTGAIMDFIASGVVGNVKKVFTTQSVITANRFVLRRSTNGDGGLKLKLNDIRVFELPAGSEIETDFNTMTADQLAIKYPYIAGDGTKSTISANRLKSVDKDGIQESTLYLPNVGELRSLPNGVRDEVRVSGGRAELVKRVSDTMEGLAEPIITPIQTSGNLISYPSGTIYVENVVADAGTYTTKFDIKELELPIKSIDKLIKYNFETGVQTVLDTSLAVINEDKKSFTHPNLIDKDMVFVDYYYDVESTLGETTIEYLDSRHTIKDTTNDKFYSWDIKSTNGVPTVELTEVL